MKHWEQFFLTAGYIHHQSSQAICVVVVCGMKMKMKIRAQVHTRLHCGKKRMV